jgi:hypothetical protein
MSVCKGDAVVFGWDARLHAEIFDVLYDSQQDAVLVGLDVELCGQHAPDLIEALFRALAPPLLHLQCKASHNATTQ